MSPYNFDNDYDSHYPRIYEMLTIPLILRYLKKQNIDVKDYYTENRQEK